MGNTARSYSSDHATSGYIARGVALSTAELGVQVAELVAEAAAVLADCDPANDRQAFAALAVISEKASQLSHTQWLVADGNLTEAKKSAQNMVQKGKKNR